MSDTRTHLWSQDPRDPFLAALGLKELLETTPDLTFVCDAEGNLIWAGGGFESLTGHPVSEVIGQPLLALLSPLARRRALRAIADQRRHQTPSFEVTVPMTDGQGRESNVTVRVAWRERPEGGLVFAGSAHAAQAGMGSGPEAGKPADTGMPQASTQGTAPTGCEGPEVETLQATEVLATMNHEIRAPMNAMIGMARLLLQTKLDEEQQALVDLIWKSGQATLRLVNDAYEFTSAESGQLDLNHIPFDLRVTVDETVASLTSLAAGKGLELECRVHPAVPSRLRGDPGRLRQVLLNLGERAIKSLARGRVELLVSRLRENDQSVTLRFLVMERRAAAGDPQPGQEALPARREPGPKPGREPGAGLGLAVIRRLAGLMGGKTGIECTSEEAYRYWFDVELEKQEALDSAAAPRLSKAELATRRALIVDSSPVGRRALRNRLEGAGCRASEAGDAEEAHAVLRAAVESGDPFHFVLIDRDLPGLDGEELGAMIRADHALDVARTVMLTTVGRRGDATRARARGFSAFLPKAVGVEELVEALCEVIHQAMATPPGGTPELVTRYSLAEGRRSKLRVLLVDDDAVSQVVTQWCLSRLGYRLEIAGTIAEARSAWSKAAFDIVLVDERLPDGDALALAQELRGDAGDSQHAALIAMFRDENSPARLGWQESGLGDFVTKPVDLMVLTRLLEQLTGTGPPSGAATDDDDAGRPAGRQKPPSPDRLEFVMPDIDRILTDSEARAAMTSAVRACAAAGATPVPVGPGLAQGATESDVESADSDPLAQVVVEDQAEALPGDPMSLEAVDPVPAVATEVPAEKLPPEEFVAGPSCAMDLLETASAPEPVRTFEWSAPADPPPAPTPAPALDTLLPVDVVALESAAPQDAAEPETAVAEQGSGAAPAGGSLAPAPACEAGPPNLVLAAPVPPMSRQQTPPGKAGEVEPAVSSSRGPARLGVVETPAEQAPAAQEPTAVFDLARLEQASMGLPSVRKALLSAFLGELSPFLEKLSWTLSDEDAQGAASEAPGLAALSRSVGAMACAEVLDELEGRGADGALKASDPILRRCYGQGLRAATEARVLLAEERRAA